MLQTKSFADHLEASKYKVCSKGCAEAKDEDPNPKHNRDPDLGGVEVLNEHNCDLPFKIHICFV